PRDREFDNLPAPSRLATIEFMLAATVSRWSVGSWMQRRLFALCCLVTNGRPPLMSTIELVDPELRDALAQLLPTLTAESLPQRRANMLELAGAVPKPNLPDIATDEIHV